MASDTHNIAVAEKVEEKAPDLSVPVEKIEEKPKESINGLETTTAHDGDIAINNDTVATPAPLLTPETPPSLSVPSAPSVPPVVAEAPVVVTAEDIAPPPVPEPATNNNQLQDEIETLTGEIQALEAKIDRLTGNISAVEPEKKPEISPLATSPLMNESLPPVKDKDKQESKPVPFPPLPESSATSSGLPKPKASTPITDIYAKVEQREKNSNSTQFAKTEDAVMEEDHGSGMGLVGEVLAIFGSVIFAALLASPLFKDMIGTDLWDAVRSIGWPTALVSLGIGFLLFLFTKGKVGLKILFGLLLLIAAVIYVSILGYADLLGPLGSVFSFYK